MQALAKNRGGKCLSEKYGNNKTKLQWECAEGHKWLAAPDKIKNSKQWCPICSLNQKKSTIDDMRKLAKNLGGKCFSDNYTNTRTRLLWECAEGHTWKAKPNSIVNGRWCPECSDTTLDIEEMHKLARKRKGRCLSSKYINIHSKLVWECEKGHTWDAKPFHIKHSDSWCPYCAGKHLSIKDMRALAKLKGGKCLSKKYEGAHVKLRWECSNRHQWKAKPSAIRNLEHWCPYCAGKHLSIKDMRALAKQKGGKCLSKKYEGAHVKLRWECGNKHQWSAKPSSIKNQENWCPECATGISERICRAYFQQVFGKPFPKRRPKWLKNSRGNQMELDGFCEKLRIAFEHQGEQHYTTGTHFVKTEEELLLRKKDDKEKKKLCNKNAVRLIAVPYEFTGTKLDEFLQFIYEECKNQKIRRPAGMLKKKIKLISAWMPIESKLIIQEMKLLAKLNGGKCLSTIYLNYATALQWRCSEGHYWDAPAFRIRKGHWCPHCAGNVRLTIEEMRAIAKAHGGKCLSKKYNNIDAYLEWQCSERHVWRATPYKIRKGNWCPQCKKK